MAVDKTAALFLSRQADQETHHAKVFNRVVSCITPRRTPKVPVALRQLGLQLERAASLNNLVETLVGQQIVLEGFGELILLRLNKKFDQRRIGFKRLRHTISQQEQGHQVFGERMLHTLVHRGNESCDGVRDLAQEYLFLVDRILGELQPMFDVVGANADQYKVELRTQIPQWTLVGAS